jgi:hypothetical protein
MAPCQHTKSLGGDMTKVINLTPHAIDLIDDEGNLVVSLPSAGIARATEKVEIVDRLTVDGAEVVVTRVTYGSLENVPVAKDGVKYVVSRLAAEAAPEREDLLVPGPGVRDAQGRIVGCKGLARL